MRTGKWIYPVALLCLGGLGGIFVASRADVHDALVNSDTPRVYLQRNCVYSRKAEEDFREDIRQGRLLALHVDPPDQDTRDRECSNAIEATGSWLASTLPRSYVCGKLREDAEVWLLNASQGETATPTFALGDRIVHRGLPETDPASKQAIGLR